MMVQPSCSSCSSSSSQQPQGPNLLPPQIAPQPVVDDKAEELKELSRLISLDQSSPEFSLVAKHYEWVRIKYTKHASGTLLFQGSKESTYLHASTLIHIFAAAYQRGVFQTKPLDSSSGAAASSPAAAAAAAPASASSIQATKESEAHPPIAEKGTVITIISTSGFVDVDEFYIRFSPDRCDNPLSILKLSSCTILGRGGFGTVSKILNVSKGIFEAMKIALDERNSPGSIDSLKKEYAILNYLENHFQDKMKDDDLPFQAAPHQLITYPSTTPGINKIAYLGRLYFELNLENLFEGDHRYLLRNQTSFHQRLLLCKRLLQGFQILSTLNVHYTDIDATNVLLRLNDKNEFVPYLGDFGGVELVSQLKENLRRELTEDQSSNALPFQGIVLDRINNMSTKDFEQLKQIRDELERIKTLASKEERIAQFESTIFPKLLEIKARKNIFAIGTLLCKILTVGRSPYSYVSNGFPNPFINFSRANMRSCLKSLISRPTNSWTNNLLYRLILAALFKEMVDQNPSNRPTLDRIVKDWELLISTWEMPDSDANEILHQLAIKNKYIRVYQPDEEVFLKSKIGTFLTPDQVIRLNHVSYIHSIGEYVILNHPHNRSYQIVQIKDMYKGEHNVARSSGVILWDGKELVSRNYDFIRAIDVTQFMTEEGQKKASAPETAAAAAAPTQSSPK